MKKYLVTWAKKKRSFKELPDACKFAEKIAEKEWSNSYVWIQENGVLQTEPFMKCELEF